MFNLRSIVIVASLTILVFWIVQRQPKRYIQLLTSPTETWTELAWWKVVLVSVPVLLVALKVFPALEMFINTNLGNVIPNPEATSQVTVTQGLSQTLGVNIGYLLSGAFMAFIAALEEIIWRGVVLHFFKEKSNWVLALLISSVLFAISHLSESGFALPFVLYVTIVGAILGAVYLKTGILGSVIIHSGYNFSLMLLTVLNL